MSRSDKDNTFVKYRFLKFEATDIYKDVISFCVYLDRAKFALSGRIKKSIYRNTSKTQKAMPIGNLLNTTIDGSQLPAIKHTTSYP